MNELFRSVETELIVSIITFISFGLLVFLFRILVKKKESSRIAAFLCKILLPFLDRNKDGEVDLKDVHHELEEFIDDRFDDYSDIERKEDQ